MANIFPSREDLSDTPYSELKVYELLSELSDEFTIFHSVRWAKYWNRWRTTWRENDFLIFNKKFGALVLEVKGGDIVCHGNVFTQINSMTGEQNELNPDKRNDPMSQAIDGIYHYRNLLDEITPGLSDRFPIEAAVWFSSCEIGDNIDNFPLRYREAKGAILGNESFSEGVNAIYKIFDFYGSQYKVNISDEEYDSIINIIASDFDLISESSMTNEELEYKFLKLTNEQLGLLDYISEQETATIQGVAGTGKTLIAKEAAKRFGMEGRKVLFLCFNRYLFKYLQNKYELENVTFYNLHSFIAKYRPGSDTSTIEKRKNELNKIDYSLIEYDDIIIDEGQDFVNDEIIYFKNYITKKKGHFYIFYDKNQLLTTSSVPQWIQESECKLKLCKNCRNTYDIAVTSYNILDIEADKNHSMKIKGIQPTISFTDGNISEKVNKLIDHYFENEAYELSDIVILSLKTLENTALQDAVKYRVVYNEKEDGAILLTTSSKFKGLESKVVIVIDIDKSSFAEDQCRRNFYVACSRASQRLSLIVDGNKDVIDDIACAISQQKKFASKGIIAMKTQTRLF